MTDKTSSNNSPKSWEQQPGEPPKWYSRFRTFLRLGPSRSLAGAYRAWTGGQGRPSQTARKRHKEWRWEERGIDWDNANHEEKVAFEAAHEAETRERNNHLNGKIFNAINVAFDVADLENLSKEEARAMLPTLRGYLNTISDLQRRAKQSSQDHDHLSASSGWPVLDEEARKILERYNDDEE
ncbi:MAG: hypothetical protein OXF86_03670 [Caldilineaceae bacterium]|nr:hypothetical protein [Caldilineaceae bacterium]